MMKCNKFSAIIAVIATLLCPIYSAATPGGYGAPGGLTGGCDGCLDKIDGTNLEDGDIAVASNGSDYFIYGLDESSAAAESSPVVIEPDANGGNKRWVLQESWYDNSTSGLVSGNVQNAIDEVEGRSDTLEETVTVQYQDYTSGSPVNSELTSPLYQVGIVKLTFNGTEYYASATVTFPEAFSSLKSLELSYGENQGLLTAERRGSIQYYTSNSTTGFTVYFETGNGASPHAGDNVKINWRATGTR